MTTPLTHLWKNPAVRKTWCDAPREQQTRLNDAAIKIVQTMQVGGGWDFINSVACLLLFGEQTQAVKLQPVP